MTEGAKVLPFPKRERVMEQFQDRLSSALRGEPPDNEDGDTKLDVSVEPLRRRPRIGGTTDSRPGDFENSVEELFDEMLERGKLQVYLDPRVDGVVVPEQFKSDSVLVLNFSKLFRPGDVYADKNGIGQTLSFDGNEFKCHIPHLAMMAVLQPQSETMLIFSDKVLQYLGPEVQKIIQEIEGPLTINPSQKLVEEKGNAEDSEEADDAG